MRFTGLIIVNPASGGGKGDTDADDAAHPDLWRRWAADLPGVEVQVTEEAGDARRLAQGAAEQRIDRVLAVGGDGTLSEVINGLRRGGGDTADDRPILTLQPAGTGNDFARSLELPHDPAATWQRFLHGSVRAMDLIRVEVSHPDPRWMINVASGGFGREVADAVDSDTKSRWGVMAYLRVAAAKMTDSPIFDATLRYDDAPDAEHRQCSAILVCNGRFVGGGRQLLDDAAPDDRRFHVMTVTANTFYERLATGSQFLIHQHLGSDCIDVRETRKLQVICDQAMGFSVDGEPNAQTPLAFTLEPAALRMTVEGRS